MIRLIFQKHSKAIHICYKEFRKHSIIIYRTQPPLDAKPSLLVRVGVRNLGTFHMKAKRGFGTKGQLR
jgi:hypothetical protein